MQTLRLTLWWLTQMADWPITHVCQIKPHPLTSWIFREFHLYVIDTKLKDFFLNKKKEKGGGSVNVYEVHRHLPTTINFWQAKCVVLNNPTVLSARKQVTSRLCFWGEVGCRWWEGKRNGFCLQSMNYCYHSPRTLSVQWFKPNSLWDKKKKKKKQSRCRRNCLSSPGCSRFLFHTHTPMDKVAIRAKDHSQRSIGNCACRCVQAVNV